jgi:RNA polymerase sigma-70 factor (sigma-E family)
MSVTGSDADAQFRAFVVAHGDTLLRVALLITADRGRAEDLVQTALMRTYSRWERLSGQDPFGYARRIIVNSNVDRWRRDRGREYLTGEVPELLSSDATLDIVQRDALMRALASLPLTERRIVVLRFLVDLSEADTAAELGMPLGTVKSVTHRAMRKLRGNAHAADLREATP